MQITKKHDEFVRKCLLDLSMAREFLANYLPSYIKDKCSFNKLRIVAGSYIEDDLKTHASDVVYQLGLKGSESCAYVYVLVEHQSTPLKLMPFRILRYQIAIIQKHMDEHPKDKLPLVIPLVFYNGTDAPYPYSTELVDLFADKELFNQTGIGNFKLADLTVTEDDEILQHNKLAFLEMLVKHIHDRNFANTIGNIVKAFQLAELNNVNPSLIHGAIHYLLSGREREDINQLIEQFKQNVPKYGETIMSYAEELRLEGIKLGEQRGRKDGIQLGEQIGLQEGIQLGEKKGKEEAQQEIAMRMLNTGISLSKVSEIVGIPVEKISNLYKN